jgi:electron transfer flavoprotein alpha/beta subunit
MRRVTVIIGSCQAVGVSEVAPPTLPPSDRAAIGLAMRRFGGPIDAYCLRDDAEAWRYALAAGVATVRRVHDVADIDFDLALVGSAGSEPWGDLLPALLAEHKQCAMVFEVLDIIPGPNGLTVTRDLGRGNREVLSLSTPAVLSISEDAGQLLYVSRYRRQTVSAVLPTPPPELAPNALSMVNPQWEPARPRVKTGDLAAKTAGPASRRIQALMGIGADASKADQRAAVMVADAVTCARHLLRFLSHHGIITRSVPAAAAPERPEQQTESRIPASPSGGRDDPGVSIRTRSTRGPRALGSQGRDVQRGPQPLQPEVEPSPPGRSENGARGPRPVGQTVSRRARGPRPVE